MCLHERNERVGAACIRSGIFAEGIYTSGSEVYILSLIHIYIPLILGGCGIALCAVWVWASCPIGTGQEMAMAVFTSIVQGILTAGLSTYVNQIIKQAGKEE